MAKEYILVLEDKLVVLAHPKTNRDGHDYYKYVTGTYGGDNQASSKLLGRQLASFIFRLTVAILLFTVYFFMEERNINIYEFTSDRITEYLAGHYFVP